jgi:hypothetical protein
MKNDMERTLDAIICGAAFQSKKQTEHNLRLVEQDMQVPRNMFWYLRVIDKETNQLWGNLKSCAWWIIAMTLYIKCQQKRLVDKRISPRGAPAIGKHVNFQHSLPQSNSHRTDFGAKVRPCSKPHYLISQSAAHSLNILSHQPTTNKQSRAVQDWREIELTSLVARAPI